MGGIDAWIASVLVEHGIHLLRLEAGYQRTVLAILLQMEAELVAKLTGPKALTDFSRQRLTDLLAESRHMIAQAYIDIRKELDPVPIMAMEADFMTKTLRQAVGVKLVNSGPSEAMLRTLANDALILGGPAKDWWTRQGQDTGFRFANAIRQGVAQGETNAKILARVTGTKLTPGVLTISKRNAEALVRTSVQAVSQDARMATMQANDDVLLGFEQISTLDSRTTQICVAYDGARWDMDRNPIAPNKLPFNGGPPRHWGCRSSLSPVVKPLVEGMPEFEPSERASTFGPTSDKTFSDWLGKRSASFQDDLLGKGKAQLFRDGKITLQQLLDQRGRPLTLAQLKERYDISS